MPIKISPNDSCPCDSGKKYKKCCRPYLSGNKAAPMPETIVRARFTAFTLGDVDYIMKTTHPDSPHYVEQDHRWRAQLEAYSLRNSFYSLKILSAADDNVTYERTLLSFGSEQNRAIEDSTFKQHNGEWLYFDSEIEEVEDTADDQAQAES